MVSIEEFELMLDDVAQTLPEEFYNGLNGGIMLLPELKLHPESTAYDLFILGEYHRNSMGRYIVIYYGSFKQMFEHLSVDALRIQLSKTLRHEFTHHLESLAGERGLEIKDAMNLEKYRNNGRL